MELSSVSVIVPAAGQSIRFGAQDKLRMPWRGSTVLQTVVAMVRKCSPLEIILVVADAGHEGSEGVRVVVNPEPDRGMASSIAVGVQAASTHATGFLVWPADMPLVPPEMVAELVGRGTVTSCVRPRYRGVPGHPVLFGGASRTSLEGLVRGPGARHLLTNAVYVDTDDRRVIEDIDTPAAYERLGAAHA